MQKKLITIKKNEESIMYGLWAAWNRSCTQNQIAHFISTKPTVTNFHARKNLLDHRHRQAETGTRVTASLAASSSSAG
jgi:hypothetical protein